MEQKDVWDSIASSWHGFKRKPFPERVAKLAEEWVPGRILDLGCGNGRNLMPFSERGFECYGVDFSKKMLELAESYFKEKNLKAEFVLGNLTKIPLEDNYFDYVICVAAFHHLNKDEQIACLNEIKRVLKKDGRVYLGVWNKWQLRFLFGKKERYVPWKKEGKVFGRYYYLFNLFELKKKIQDARFKIEVIKGLFNKNIEVIFRK
jgi:ubiquinone/menaquinone biosynthesis C-methylase UbiE